MIYQLTYRSEAIANITIDQINSILKTARNFNSAHDITGCLVFSKGFFLQILEGNKETIKALFESIEGDNRHSYVRVLSQQNSDQRVFKDWDMAFFKPSEKVTNVKTKALMKTLEELSNDQEKPNFTSKVFWYNIETLLTDRGFYGKHN